MKTKKKKTKTSKKILYLVIFSTIAYTIAAFALQFYGNIEISPTLTTCFFTMFTVEILSLSSIKKSKIKNNYPSESNINKESDSNSVNEG